MVLKSVQTTNLLARLGKLMISINQLFNGIKIVIRINRMSLGPSTAWTQPAGATMTYISTLNSHLGRGDQS